MGKRAGLTQRLNYSVLVVKLLVEVIDVDIRIMKAPGCPCLSIELNGNLRKTKKKKQEEL